MASADTAQQWGGGPGEVLSGRYRLGEQLGEGGMGAVFVGEHLMMKKTVAVKLLHPERTADERMVARFHREAQSAAALDHPNICRVTDFGQTDDEILFLVMEYLEGRTVRRLIEIEAPLSVKRALDIARQIAVALGEAHRHDIVHRDLKPENVMLVDGGGDLETVKLTDFGLALVLAGDCDEDAPARLTRAGEVFGTPHFMAPEQVAGDDVDGRTDLYALGALLFESLTGTPPYEAEKVTRLMAKHLTAPIPKLEERTPDLDFPAGMQALIDDLMAKNIDERPASARQVVERIDAIQSGDESARRKPAAADASDGRCRQKDHSSRTTRLAMAAVALGGLVLMCTVPGIVYVYLNMDRSSETVDSEAEASQMLVDQERPESPPADEAPDEAESDKAEPHSDTEPGPDGRPELPDRGRDRTDGPPGRTKGKMKGAPRDDRHE